MKKRLILCFLILPGLFGCRTTLVRDFVVYRDVPTSPEFVVLPFNQYQPQILCAEQAESALIAAGVKVIAPPPRKNVEITKGVDAGQKNLSLEAGQVQYSGKSDSTASLEAARAFETKVEAYQGYGEISADYIVTTNGTIKYYGGPYIESIRVRIFKKDSNEVLASFNTYSECINDDMYKTLESLGVKVKQKP
ncbi:MAG: hypothetical protein M0036_08110 [Desulfobacteraceae bacterium]|nr:hypothetical protein [Desulfobacteraceae bacterium]